MGSINKKKDNILVVLLLIFVISGIFGFIYEELFYRIDLGYFVKRGTTFGPWIPIYGFGGLLMAVGNYKIKKNPLIVFIACCIISGLLEFLTGYILFHYSGIRLWDYNVEIWNFGNIGGYICLRSVLFFGISGIFLEYCIIHFIHKYLMKKNNVKFGMCLLSCLFFIDFLVNDVFKISFLE